MSESIANMTLYISLYRTVNNSVCVNGEVRLVGGDTLLEGRAEVCFGGRWGTICNDEWDNFDASVLCNQLGYSRIGQFNPLEVPLSLA